MINELLTCPADCDTALLLPALPEEQDCTNYEILKSQVSDLFIRPTGAPDIFASWATTPTYVADSVDNTVTDNSKTKWLVGIGSVAIPEKETVQYPKGKTKTKTRIYTLNFKVMNMDATTREFCRKLQCGSTDFSFYYGDRSDFAYGKAGGLTPKSIDVDMPQEGDENSSLFANIIITWEADADAERKTNPYA